MFLELGTVFIKKHEVYCFTQLPDCNAAVETACWPYFRTFSHETA
jgi:hypothetical protein